MRYIVWTVEGKQYGTPWGVFDSEDRAFEVARNLRRDYGWDTFIEIKED